MDPYDERRLIEEVIYLHSLWRQGPPRNPNPNPRPNVNNPSTILHQPSISTPFKNINAKKKKNKKKKKKIMANHENPLENSDILWQQTVVAESPTSASGWPAFKPSSCQAVKKPLSAEDEAKSLANKMQQKGLEASSNFFSRNCCLDDDEDEYEDSDDDDDIDMDDCEECEEYKFFLNMFKEENDLRNYYEKNYEAGDFFCLVCCGIGKKVWRRYKNCVAVVQHSVGIANTKKKIAHRAFGQVICKVLGWDINRLPTIVLSTSDTLTQSLAKHGDSQNALKEGDSITLEADSVKVMSDVGSNTKGLLNCSEMLVEDGAEGAQIKMDNIEKEILVADDLKDDGVAQIENCLMRKSLKQQNEHEGNDGSKARLVLLI